MKLLSLKIPARLNSLLGNKRFFYLLMVALYPILIPGVLSASVFLLTDIENLRTIGRSTEYASIDYPLPDSPLAKNFKVNGTLKRAQDSYAVYLVTNNDDLIWPKTKLDKQKSNWEYSLTINPGSKFNISVIAVDRNAAALIERWFKTGADTGKYPALTVAPGMQKVAQITVEK